jgi:hypothetical protein
MGALVASLVVIGKTTFPVVFPDVGVGYFLQADTSGRLKFSISK